MSDGERSVFYLIGQTLMVEPGTLIVFDEPEIHLHRAIMSRLWDELEAVRPDCGMVVISHDLEFVAGRCGQKYVLKDYHSSRWQIESVPEETGFSEEGTTLILGSRQPILFVEGKGSSLDKALFRACYPDWTVISRGSCEEVIHSVRTMRANKQLTRVTCAGIVDADGRSPEEERSLAEMGIKILPVSEIENLFLLPEVIEAIACSDGHDPDAAITKREGIVSKVLAHAEESKNREQCIIRHVCRCMDRRLKKIDLSESKNRNELAENFKEKIAQFDVKQEAVRMEEVLNSAIKERDIKTLLKHYDNKGLLAIVAKARGCCRNEFEKWVVRVLRNKSVSELTKALEQYLPKINAQ